MATTTTSLKLDDALKARIQKLAEQRKRTPHWLMKEAIEQYVDDEEKRESFRQDAIAAWEDYERTGLHLTHEEVMAWLRKRAKGEDVELPECHT